MNERWITRLPRRRLRHGFSAAGAFVLLLLLVLCGCAGAHAPLAPYILSAVQSMPEGGGYAADRAAEIRLAERGIVWRGGQLEVSPTGASPTFCSAACYIVLLRALRAWEQGRGAALSPRVWHSLRVEPQHPDGFLSWGRVNANGPGLAKWVADLRAGISFTSVRDARPGDFLKFFHTPALGASERGHLVVFLGLAEQGGQLCVRYWSSNKPNGYGVRTTPLARLHHLIFTRITRPERLSDAPLLPLHDPWLGSLLTSPTGFAEVSAKCSLRSRAE